MTKLCSRAALLVAILGAPTGAAGQDSPAPERSTFWGFGALGIGGARDSTFFAAGVGAAFQRRKLVLMGRIAAVGPERQNRVEDFGLLAGLGTRPGRPLHFLVAAGLATVHDYRDSSALALPVEVHATWRFSRFAGVGVRGFLSINKLSDFGGLTVAVHAGRLQ